MDERTRQEILEAKRRQEKIRERAGGSFNSVIDVRDLDPNRDYVFALLSLLPGVGAAHWFTPVGESQIKRFNCCANLMEDDSYGDNPKVCPACYAAVNKLVDIDMYQGHYNGPQILIYYPAVIGSVILYETEDGTMKRKIDWSTPGPCIFSVRPSINNIIANYLGNVDYYDGDIRAYLWKFDQSGNGFDKYKGTQPFVKQTKIIPTPKEIIDNRDKILEQLPSMKELLKPTSPEEMADALGISMDEIQEIETTPKPVSNKKGNTTPNSPSEVAGNNTSIPEDEVDDEGFFTFEDDIPF